MVRDVLTFILAGGRGQRLDPLTRDRAKPAVPFGGIYRIIDFTLSNCVNSGLRKIFVLTQYKSFSLQRHLLSGWDVVSNQLGEFIDVVPAQQRIGGDWYRGTADAIFQNIYAIEDYNPKHTLILSGDHIYKMNYDALLQYHVDQKADVTVACVPLPKETSKDFGVIEVDNKDRVKGFQEKPSDPKVLPNNKKMIYASMGIYLFNTQALKEELSLDADMEGSDHDFGKNIIPQMIANKRRVFGYKFIDEEGNPKYWRDIGTRDAYYQANMDLLGQNPLFHLYDKSWPVRTYHEQHPPVKILSTKTKTVSVVDSLVSAGCIIEGSHIEHSVLSPNVYVGDGAEVVDSVIMEGVIIEKGAKVRNAIIDKQVRVPSGVMIGYDKTIDQQRFSLTTSGIAIASKKVKIEV